MNRFKKIVLDNGIRLYVHGDKTMKKYSVSYTVDYGSSGEFYKFNYDGKDYEVLPGCAHFLEHMLLEQSKYGNLYHYFKDLNYFANATTDLQSTSFYFTGTKKVKSSIYKLIDSLENPVFDTKAIKEVSPAIEEETKIFDNRPEVQAMLLSLLDSYKGFNFEHESLSPIGTEETTKMLDYDMLKLCYDAFYSDDRKIIVITGPLDETDMINYIKRIYSKIRKHKNKTKLFIPDDLVSVRKREDKLVKNTVESDMLIINYKEQLKDFSVFEINSYLNYLYNYKFSAKTNFYEDNKKDGILLFNYGIDVFYAFQNEIKSLFNMNFYFYITDKDKFIKAFEKEIKINKFDEKDFELYKRARLSDILVSDEDKYHYYNCLANNIILYREEIDYVDSIKNLSYDRFIEFYNSLKLDNRVITLLTKEG